MQKIILLLLLVCLVYCTAQESDIQSQESEIQSLIYTPAHNIDVIQRVSADSSYLCPDSYVYLVRDFQIFNGVVCVDTIITDTVLQPGDCSPGWATISFNEVSANQRQYCDMLGSGGVARIGFMGSLTANGCSQSDWDISSITQTICVQREIKDIMLVRSNDNNICGEGRVLLTQQEAQANQVAYCNLLEEWDIIRLADGGSMDGPGWSGGSGCKIRYEDRRGLGGALCRAISNSEPDKTENVPISETTFDGEQPLPILVPSQETVISNNQVNSEGVIAIAIPEAEAVVETQELLP